MSEMRKPKSSTSLAFLLLENIFLSQKSSVEGRDLLKALLVGFGQILRSKSQLSRVRHPFKYFLYCRLGILGDRIVFVMHVNWNYNPALLKM